MRLLFCLAILFPALVACAQTKTSSSDTAASLQHKLQHIEENARHQPPDPAPTVLTEQEVNAYLASGDVQLPAGVESVHLQAQPGTVNGTARVDFDKVKAGQNSSNPLLSVFSGVHDVQVMTQSHGSGGRGYVHVDSVSIDGIEVPHFALQLFVDKYIKPKYPDVGIDSQFVLPDRIDTAVVGLHKVTIVQK